MVCWSKRVISILSQEWWKGMVQTCSDHIRLLAIKDTGETRTSVSNASCTLMFWLLAGFKQFENNTCWFWVPFSSPFVFWKNTRALVLSCVQRKRTHLFNQTSTTLANKKNTHNLYINLQQFWLGFLLLNHLLDVFLSDKVAALPTLLLPYVQSIHLQVTRCATRRLCVEMIRLSGGVRSRMCSARRCIFSFVVLSAADTRISPIRS